MVLSFGNPMAAALRDGRSDEHTQRDRRKGMIVDSVLTVGKYSFVKRRSASADPMKQEASIHSRIQRVARFTSYKSPAKPFKRPRNAALRRSDRLVHNVAKNQNLPVPKMSAGDPVKCVPATKYRDAVGSPAAP